MKTQDAGKIIRIVAVLSSLTLPSFASAMEAPEERIVTGQQSLTQLQRQIDQAQDRMFGMFNELNDDDRYDIHCRKERRTGTILSQRVCKPGFLRNSTSLNANAYLATLQGGAAVSSPDPQAESGYHYPILREKMNALAGQNPEFAEAVAKHYELSEELKRRTSAASEE